MSAVRLDQVAKQFGDIAVVTDVSLDVADGELVALLGPSGSGKTTLLRLVAGFEHTDRGRIFLDGDDVTQRPALQRRCGMVFQHYALFPHMDVAGNVGYGLASEGLGRAGALTRVSEVLELVDLAGYEHRPVTALSGGQQQRVALARALAPRPRVLLLDEPLSNLDPSLRERTRRELRDLVRRIGITTLLVTHEQEEAFDLADRIAVLHRGRLEQVGTPQALYASPKTPFVAAFVGRTSRLAGRVVGPAVGGVVVEACGVQWHAAGDTGLTGEVSLLVRPEGAALSDTGAPGTIVRRRFGGAVEYLSVALDDGSEIEVAVSPGTVRDAGPVRIGPTGVGAFAFGAAS